MDVAVKHLRDGVVREEQGCALLCIFDSLDVIGGRAVFEQVPTPLPKSPYHHSIYRRYMTVSLSVQARAAEPPLHGCRRWLQGPGQALAAAGAGEGARCAFAAPACSVGH